MNNYFFKILLIGCLFSITANANGSHCSRETEVDRLKKYSKLVTRDGGKLSLKIGSGKGKSPRVYENTYYDNEVDKSRFANISNAKLSKNADEVLYYDFCDLLEKQNLYLIKESIYEGNQFIIIDTSSGAEGRIPAEPYFSASKNKFAAASIDLEANFNPNKVEVWEKKKKWEKVFDKDFTTDSHIKCSVMNPKWINDDTVILDKHCLDTKTYEDKKYGTAKVINTNNKWEYTETLD